ncbi:hypothetical protein O0L34_g176 [Tuta absoluta]|nr:hypothetical protein O0L34_g176 [Tuta absoluta]
MDSFFRQKQQRMRISSLYLPVWCTELSPAATLVHSGYGQLLPAEAAADADLLSLPTCVVHRTQPRSDTCAQWLWTASSGRSSSGCGSPLSTYLCGAQNSAPQRHLCTVAMDSFFRQKQQRMRISFSLYLPVWCTELSPAATLVHSGYGQLLSAEAAADADLLLSLPTCVVHRTQPRSDTCAQWLWTASFGRSSGGCGSPSLSTYLCGAQNSAPQRHLCTVAMDSFFRQKQRRMRISFSLYLPVWCTELSPAATLVHSGYGQLLPAEAAADADLLLSLPTCVVHRTQPRSDTCAQWLWTASSGRSSGGCGSPSLSTYLCGAQNSAPQRHLCTVAMDSFFRQKQRRMRISFSLYLPVWCTELSPAATLVHSGYGQLLPAEAAADADLLLSLPTCVVHRTQPRSDTCAQWLWTASSGRSSGGCGSPSLSTYLCGAQNSAPQRHLCTVAMDSFFRQKPQRMRIFFSFSMITSSFLGTSSFLSSKSPNLNTLLEKS